MLQDVIDYVKKVALDDFNMLIMAKVVLPKDKQLDKALYVVTTKAIESIPDMCGNRYNFDNIHIQGTSATFNTNNEEELEMSNVELQASLDKLANELVSRTSKQTVNLNPTTEIIQFNNSFSIHPAEVESTGEYVYELVITLQWLSIKQ